MVDLLPQFYQKFKRNQIEAKISILLLLLLVIQVKSVYKSILIEMFFSFCYFLL